MIYFENSARITFRSAFVSVNVELNFSLGEKLETSAMKLIHSCYNDA